jgi:uncharacterized protein (TIGR03435 family)
MKRIILAAAVLNWVVCAQTAPTDHPQFEVASIKPNTSGNGLVMIRPPVGGRFTATNVTLNMLVGLAYKLRPNQISGGPAWAASERYDILAKAEGNPAQDQLASMVRALLEERFQLVAHKETKDMPVYALLIAKNGPKLPAAKDDACTAFSPDKPPPPPPQPGQPFQPPPTPCGGFLMMGNRLEAGKVGMAQLVNVLANVTGRTVIDKTGYTGTFDVHLEWTPEGGMGRGGPFARPGVGAPGGAGVGIAGPGPGPGGDPGHQADSSGPSIFTAIQEQLGLRLESQKAPVETLVIDRAEKPTEN